LPGEIVTISVALVSASGVRGDLLESVVEQDPEFHLISRSTDLIATADALAGLPSDAVVVWTLSGEVPREAELLLDACSFRALVSLTPDGKDMRLRVPGGEQRHLRNPSPARLLDAIRDAVG
jgi:hypothetical protein